MRVYTYVASRLDLNLFFFRLFLVKYNIIPFIFALYIGFLLLSFSFQLYSYFNELLLDKDSFLFIGESSSQGSNPHNINSGGGSSNNPNPNSNPNSNPGPGPNYGNHTGYFDTVMIRDTDRLANHLEHFRGKFIQASGVMFADYHGHSHPVGLRHADLSRVVRYVRDIHPEWFYRVGPNTTRISDDLIRQIRDLHRDVPSDFF